MAEGTQRPKFFHGEVLGADKLNESVAYGAAQLGRHNRLLHTWGIADGLELKEEKRTTSTNQPYVQVTLGPGVAIDGYGYELILRETEAIEPADFLDANVLTTDGEDPWYPVFVVGTEREESAAEQTFAQTCRTSTGTVVLEEVSIEYGSPGAQQELDRQAEVIGLDEGPGTGADTRPRWRILVGYVRFDATLERFAAAKMKLEASDVSDPAQAVQRRYAGARAEQVLAPGGTLYLRSAPASETGTAALGVNYEGDVLVIGTHDGTGGIKPLLRVKPNGDVQADQGSFIGVSTAGVHVQSGTATDGMILPLPDGISQAQIDDGTATLHISLTPRYSVNSPAVPPLGGSGVPFPSEIWVDSDRRLHCKIRWTDVASAAATVLPGAADYQIVANVKGGTSP